MKSVKIGVVGTGKMGINHCVAIQKINNAELTGVYDVQEIRRKQVAASFDCIAYESYANMLEDVQAVILSLPSTFHYAYFAKAIKAGRDVLVEKPFVTTVEEVSKVKSLLSNTGNIIEVGHIERFNPVISMLHKVVDREKMLAIEAHRCTLSDRSLNVDVALDLMTHDIDIILSLVSEPILSITSSATTLPDRKLADFATASITFQNGVVANLVSSRMSYRPARFISITEQNRSILADSLGRSVSIYRLPEPVLNDTNAKLAVTTTQDVLAVPHGDALYEELTHFVHCVQHRKYHLADTWAALRSVELAIQIQQQFAMARRKMNDAKGHEEL